LLQNILLCDKKEKDTKWIKYTWMPPVPQSMALMRNTLWEHLLILLVCVYTVSFETLLGLLKFILSSPTLISSLVVYCSLFSCGTQNLWVQVWRRNDGGENRNEI